MLRFWKAYLVLQMLNGSGKRVVDVAENKAVEVVLLFITLAIFSGLN
jgi:hypothetical protein